MKKFKMEKDWDFWGFNVFLCVVLFIVLMVNYPNFWLDLICCILIFYILKILHFVYVILKKVVMLLYGRFIGQE